MLNNPLAVAVLGGNDESAMNSTFDSDEDLV